MQEGFPPEHGCELFTHSLEHLLVLVFSVAIPKSHVRSIQETGKMMKPCQTLFLKKKSTQGRERKRNKGQGPKSRQANSPTEAGHKE
jgi:hypothetical protein